VAVLEGKIFELHAGVEHDVAERIEDREAAATAGQVTFVGSQYPCLTEPGDGIRLAGDIGQAAHGIEQPVVLGVDVHEIHRAGREVVNHLGRGQVDKDDVVVLLQGDRGHVEPLDAHVLRLRVRGGRRRQPGQVDRAQGPVLGSPVDVSTCSAPPGSWGSPPSTPSTTTSSSRWFSMTMAA
jgi:hypothetical protein